MQSNLGGKAIGSYGTKKKFMQEVVLELSFDGNHKFKERTNIWAHQDRRGSVA